MWLIVRRIVEMASSYGRARLVVFTFVVFALALLAMLATASVTPLMHVVFSNEKSFIFAGSEFSFTTVILLFLFCQLSLCIGSVVAEWLKARYIAHYGAWLRVTILTRVMRKPYAYFTESDASLVRQTVNEYAGFLGQLTNNLLELTMKCILLVGFLLIALWLSPWLTLAMSFITGIYYLLVVGLFKRLRLRISDSLKEGNDRLQSYSMQTIQGVKSLRVSCSQEIFVRQYEKAAETVAKNQVLPNVLSQTPRYLFELLLMSVLAGYFYWSYKQGSLLAQLPSVSVLVFVAFKAFPLVQGAYSLYNNLVTQTFFIEKVYEEMFGGEIEREAAEPILFQHEISTKGLIFKYQGEQQSIHYPDLSIRRGEIVGVQGCSGCGKSTLIDLLLGLYAPSKGAVLVDGQKVSAAALRSLYPKVGYVGQDPFLLRLSIAKNIALCPGDEVDMARVVRAAKLAQIDSHIETLAEGYHTKVGDRGVKLSGGQRQRVAIARALYAEPEILFLDEATSALDNETESRLMDTIYALPKEMTIVMVAHRLTTLQRADKIITLG